MTKRKAGAQAGEIARTPTTGLSPVQMRAVDLHVEGMSNTAIAKKLVKSRNTIASWLDEPAAVAEIDRQVRQRRRRLRSRIESVAGDAIESLVEVAASKVRDPETGEERYQHDPERRTQAARVILQHAIPTREEVEITGEGGGPIAVEVTSQSVTLELSKLFGGTKQQEGT